MLSHLILGSMIEWLFHADRPIWINIYKNKQSRMLKEEFQSHMYFAGATATQFLVIIQLVPLL